MRLSLRVDVIEDAAAAVYIGTSRDLPGLICEALDIPALTKEIHATAHELLEIQLQQTLPSPIANLHFE